MIRNSQRWKIFSKSRKESAANLPPLELLSTMLIVSLQPTKPKRSFLNSKSMTKPVTRVKYRPYHDRQKIRLSNRESRMKASRRERKANRRARVEAKAEAKKLRNKANQSQSDLFLLINLPSPRANLLKLVATKAFRRCT